MASRRKPPRFDKRVTNFLKGLNRTLDARLLDDNELTEVQNFLPRPYGGLEKIKVWRKNLFAVEGTTDDRVYTGDTEIAAASAALAAVDAALPTFDNFRKCHYFYTNLFSTDWTGAPIEIDGNNWTQNYEYAEPQGLAVIKAGLLLSNAVIVKADDPLVVSVPVRENGAYDALTHVVTASLYLVDGTVVAGLAAAEATVNLVSDGAHGRLQFEIVPSGANVVLPAGEYYLLTEQATTTPAVDGYSFVLADTSYSDNLWGWAEIPRLAEDEAIAYTDLTVTPDSGAYTAIEPFAITTDHAHANTPVLYEASYSGDVLIKFTFRSGGLYGIIRITMGSSSVAEKGANAFYAVDTPFSVGDVVKNDTSTELYLCIQAVFNNDLTDAAYWKKLTFLVGGDSLPYSATIGSVESQNLYSIEAIASSAYMTGVHSLAVDYYYAQYLTLGELFVYQKNSTAAAFNHGATRMLATSRYAKKNEAMTDAVRTEESIEIYNLTDGSGLYSLYELKQAAEAADDELLFAAAMFNTETHYTKWRTALGAESASAIAHFLPKFMGEIRAFETYQKMQVVAGVGGISVFDPLNLLEQGSAGKINTPWSDIIVLDCKGRSDSQYLADAGVATVAVHPPVIEALAVHGINPQRLVFGYGDRFGWTGGESSATLGDVTVVQTLARVRFGDNTDEIGSILSHKGRVYLFTKSGELYFLNGDFPTTAALGYNTLNAEHVATVGVVRYIVKTTRGFAAFVTVDGNLWKLENAFPEELDFKIGSDLEIESFQWDATGQRLWVGVGEHVVRSYESGGDIVDVEEGPGSYVWDTKSDTWWFVQNPLDVDDRAQKPPVFRIGNQSWSCGYRYDGAESTYTFTWEVENAGKDSIVLHNSDEARKQPDGSTAHALESTAYLITKEWDFGSEDWPFLVEALKQIREAHVGASLLTGSTMTVSVLYADNSEEEVGTVAGDCSYADMENRLYECLPGALETSTSVRLKVAITSASRDRVRSVTPTVIIGGKA